MEKLIPPNMKHLRPKRQVQQSEPMKTRNLSYDQHKFSESVKMNTAGGKSSKKVVLLSHGRLYGSVWHE